MVSNGPQPGSNKYCDSGGKGAQMICPNRTHISSFLKFLELLKSLDVIVKRMIIESKSHNIFFLLIKV